MVPEIKLHLQQHLCLHLFSTVQQCPDPGEVVNGARSVRPEAFFAVGTVVRFSCNEGYQLEGPSQISCHGRDTGTPKWSDRSPKCVCKFWSLAPLLLLQKICNNALISRLIRNACMSNVKPGSHGA